MQTLVSEFQEAGDHAINFNPDFFSSGIYFYELQVGSEFRETKKMLLVK